jgi:large subunit ribosomal protein L3
VLLPLLHVVIAVGSIKRWGMKRGAMSHGSKSHREHGSTGPGTTPGRTFPGLKMAGHMGNVRRKSKALEVREGE